MSKKTVEIIVKTDNYYVLEAKANQKKLLNQVAQIVNNNKPLDTHTTSEKNRGRTENRQYEIYDLPPSFRPLNEAWKSIQRIIFVHRYGHRPDKKSNDGRYSQKHYYITNFEFNTASYVAAGIRGHWGIENKIHYVKDTQYKEDDNGIRHNSAAAILSIFQDIAINIYRCLGFKSIKTATINFANKVNELFVLFNAYHISDL